jgi:hypothetical protein
MFTQFGRMAETLVDHALNSRGQFRLADQQCPVRPDVTLRRMANQ